MGSPTYPPLDTLKCVCDDVWIVDGPLLRFGFVWPKLPFPTRMTVLRLARRRLFVHSPTPLTPDLCREIRREGEPHWLVGPNRIHYWWLPEWHAQFPNAQVFLAPKIREQAGPRIDFPSELMGGDRTYPWDDELTTLPVSGDFMTEMVFFHHASRTLVLTDLVENFEPHKLSWALRWLTWLGAVQDPDGQTPRDLRATFRRSQHGLREAVEQMIAWNPQRIVIAHGRWYESRGAEELRRSFRWLLR